MSCLFNLCKITVEIKRPILRWYHTQVSLRTHRHVFAWIRKRVSSLETKNSGIYRTQLVWFTDRDDNFDWNYIIWASLEPPQSSMSVVLLTGGRCVFKGNPELWSEPWDLVGLRPLKASRLEIRVKNGVPLIMLSITRGSREIMRKKVWGRQTHAGRRASSCCLK